ncbi:HNH endonuclease family protein [uncultured Corynebacterium sp.]|uniref:HNH endonuclease family protein n=1 Tax=uncultured Corynebacterium sp. TaxID=159447 RepID=UPI0025DAC713|nr:HNH endonuclease family protein [uncultured Corynebacterium sp.]
MGIVLSLSLLISLAGFGDIATQSTNGSGSANSPANNDAAPADGDSSPADSPDHGSHEPPTAEAVFPGSPHAEHIGQLSKQESADALTALNVPFPTGDIHALLAALPESPRRGGAERYERKNFGPSWADVDRNGCDTRNDILHRDLTNITTKPPQRCVVLTGELHDPYTGTTINFHRGKKTSQAIQIDHVVALSNAWSSGAYALPYAARTALANDPLNLLAVDGPTNNAKSDKDAAEWMPPNTDYQCGYADRQVRVKSKYHLRVTRQEKEALTAVLSQCPA